MAEGRGTELDVWNAALSAVTGRAVVSDPDENSREAEVCRQWYTIIRDTVQEAAWWTAGRKTATLARLSERSDAEEWQAGDPAPAWQFAYALPADLLRPRYLSVGIPGYSAFLPRIPFSIELYTAAQGEDRPALHTNYADSPVILTYTKQSDNPGQWGASQFQATAYSLAATIAMPLIGNEEVANRNFQLAQALIQEAITVAANDGTQEPTPDPEWLRARHGQLVRTDPFYTYPYRPISSTIYPDALK